MSEHSPRPDRCIVVIEDEFLIRELAVCELEENGFRVVEFATADEALVHLNGHADEIAVIFTDVQMPGRLNGLDLAGIVARTWPGLPVLVTSGGLSVDAASLPPYARFVPKPWRGPDIARRIEVLSMRDARPDRAPLATAG